MLFLLFTGAFESPAPLGVSIFARRRGIEKTRSSERMRQPVKKGDRLVGENTAAAAARLCRMDKEGPGLVVEVGGPKRHQFTRPASSEEAAENQFSKIQWGRL